MWDSVISGNSLQRGAPHIQLFSQFSPETLACLITGIKWDSKFNILLEKTVVIISAFLRLNRDH